MKFGAEAIEEFADVRSQGVFRPGSELPPVVLGLLPKDFDHIQFRAIGWQVAEEGIELLHPAQSEAVVQAMVNTGVVENDEGWHGFGDLRHQVLHEIDEGLPVDRRTCLGVIQPLPGKVQGAHHRHALMMGRRHRMRSTDRRPGPLHGR